MVEDLTRYNSIIVGAGHNGLVCANYLARKGQKVLILEASASVGGLAAKREFHPGFHAAAAHSINHFSGKVAADLQLAKYGFSADNSLPLIGLSDTQNHIRIENGQVLGVGGEDATSYSDYLASMRKFARALAPFWMKKMPRIGPGGLADMWTFSQLGLKLRMLGKKDMQEFLRVFSLPARDLMDENFDHELLKAVLSWDGVIGARMAPRSPNSSVLAMLYRQTQEGSADIPGGKVASLIGALEKSATNAGVEIRCGAPVNRISIQAEEGGLRAAGVELNNGERIEADRVISATDPQRTFIDLVGVQYLDIGFTNRIRRLRCDGLVGKLHLALSGLPDFPGLEQADGRMIVAPDMDAIEFAYDNSKYGECPEQPVMELVIPSLQDSELAPAGQHVLSAHVMYIPYQLKGGWTDAAREQMCQQSIDTIARYAPGIREQIVHAEFLTPEDLENTYHVTGGHWHHTEFAIDQMLMMRPTYGAAQYSTPIPGLYLCSAGSHPGGDLVGAAGHNAAQEVLR
ncbi:MAG: NAD(P)/FAD-dependent oxidoreductase [Pseudomonadota bacterium]